MITSAKYMADGSINAQVDGVSVFVPNDPVNRYRVMIAEWEKAGNVITPYTPPPAPPAITYKGDIWRRVTDAQADVIDTALSALNTRQRRLWDDAQYLDHSDPLVGMLRTQMTDAFGAAEANRILAPSE